MKRCSASWVIVIAIASKSATPWTLRPHRLTRQVPLSMGFSRQEYWSSLLLPPPRDFSQPRDLTKSPVSPALAGRFFITEPPGNSSWVIAAAAAAAAAKSLQLCPTLCNPMDGSLPGSSVRGVFQARVLEWGAIAYSVISTLFATIWPPSKLPLLWHFNWTNKYIPHSKKKICKYSNVKKMAS